MAGASSRWVQKYLFIAEGVLFVGASIAAFFLRFLLSDWIIGGYPHLVSKTLLAVFVTQLCLYYNDLYRVGRSRRIHEVGLAVLQAMAVATTALLALYYVFPSLLIGRGVFFPMMLLFTSVSVTLRVLIHVLFRHGRLSKRVLVLGSGKSAVSIIKHLTDPHRLEYRLVGFLKEDLARLGPFQSTGQAVGSYKDLLNAAIEQDVELIIVAMDDRRGRLPLNDLAECKLRGVEVIDASQFWEVVRGVISVQDLKPSWLIFSEGFRQSKFTMLLKTFGECVLSAVALVFLAPVVVLTAAAIRAETPGPVLFRQLRVGARGKVFTLYKFRSMRLDAESDGKAQWAAEDDPRITRVGRFIRRYRLDELPQLFNVVRGDMSLVGPRPERPQFVDELLRQIPCYSQRLAVKPGVTGLAQVKMRYGASVEDAVEKLEYDLYYVKHLSISLDLAIFLDTLKVVLLGKGAR